MRSPVHGYVRTLLGSAVAGLLAVGLAASAAQADGHAAGVPAQIVEPSANFRSWTYAPATIEAAVGQPIVWTNTGGAPHTVTASDGTFDSGNMTPGETFTWTPAAPGTVAYICTYHPWMTGTVVVAEAGAAPAEAAPAESDEAAPAVETPPAEGAEAAPAQAMDAGSTAEAAPTEDAEAAPATESVDAAPATDDGY